MVEIMSGGYIRSVEERGDKFFVDSVLTDPSKVIGLLEEGIGQIPMIVRGLPVQDPLIYQKQLSSVLRELGELNGMAARARQGVKSEPLKLVKAEPVFVRSWWMAMIFESTGTYTIKKLEGTFPTKEHAHEAATDYASRISGCTDVRVYNSQGLAERSARLMTAYRKPEAAKK
jgi:hypothetical protein